jgi:hypothetical protein
MVPLARTPFQKSLEVRFVTACLWCGSGLEVLSEHFSSLSNTVTKFLEEHYPIFNFFNNIYSRAEDRNEFYPLGIDLKGSCKNVLPLTSRVSMGSISMVIRGRAS